MKVLILLTIMVGIGVSAAERFKNEICREKPFSGAGTKPNCRYNTISWTYYRKINKCIGYMSGNCGENYNRNRFGTRAECEQMCKLDGIVRRKVRRRKPAVA